MFFPPLIWLIHSSFGWSATNISSWDGADQWRTTSPFQVWSKLPSCICAALGKYFSHTCMTGSVTDHQSLQGSVACSRTLQRVLEWEIPGPSNPNRPPEPPPAERRVPDWLTAALSACVPLCEADIAHLMSVQHGHVLCDIYLQWQ